MQIAQGVAQHLYQVGEEVVVRLGGVDALDTASGATARALPAWVIAEISERLERDGRAAYALRFALGDGAYVCVAGEDQIDGTA